MPTSTAAYAMVYKSRCSTGSICIAYWHARPSGSCPGIYTSACSTLLCASALHTGTHISACILAGTYSILHNGEHLLSWIPSCVALLTFAYRVCGHSGMHGHFAALRHAYICLSYAVGCTTCIMHGRVAGAHKIHAQTRHGALATLARSDASYIALFVLLTEMPCWHHAFAHMAYWHSRLGPYCQPVLHCLHDALRT